MDNNLGKDMNNENNYTGQNSNNDNVEKNISKEVNENNNNSYNEGNTFHGNEESNINFTMIQDTSYDTIPNMSPIGEENSKEENKEENKEDKKKVKKEKKNKSGNKSMGSYIAVALICSILGGSIGTAAGYGIMKNNFDSAIADVKKEISAGASIGETTSLSAIGGIDIPSIVDQVSPAVVGVSTKSIATNMFGFSMGEQEGLGSGAIFSEDGYVLTNYHVIKNSTQVKVIFSTGKEVDAKVVNYDEAADLAVVKITEDVKMPGVVELGNSDNIKAGEQVIAIGNPLGKEYLGSVTTGIVSAVKREVQKEDGTSMNLIQTDTAINSGNSGGPLINSQGQVIGINTAKIQATGVEGIGFAIPINDAISKLDMLVKQKITLGISVVNVTEDLSKQYDLPVGVFIKRVDHFSIAQKGGLQPGDVITKFGGKEVKTVEELNEIKGGYNDGDTMQVEFVRNGKTMSAELVAE